MIKHDIELSHKLLAFLLEKGASIVGFGDLSEIPEENRKSFQTGVVIGVSLTQSVVEGIKNGPTTVYYNEYQRINHLLSQLSNAAEIFLIKAGYQAFAQIPTVVVENEKTWRTTLPHKTVATRAGIGWIGNCALLVT